MRLYFNASIHDLFMTLPPPQKKKICHGWIEEGIPTYIHLLWFLPCYANDRLLKVLSPLIYQTLLPVGNRNKIYRLQLQNLPSIVFPLNAVAVYHYLSRRV